MIVRTYDVGTGEHAMTQGEEPDGTPTAPDPGGDQGDPDKDGRATPVDDDQSPRNADLNAGALSQPTSTHEPVPDESTLMGKVGVEDEILAELARAEARMSDPAAPDDPDAAGAQI
jgi:hypothetical protein